MTTLDEIQHCKNCFYRRPEAETYRPRCKRFPPVAAIKQERPNEFVGMYHKQWLQPEVEDHDWCGEWTAESTTYLTS